MSIYLRRDCLTDPRTSGVTPSEMDNHHWKELRRFVKEFLQTIAIKYVISNGRLLEIGPGNLNEPLFSHVTIETLDIDNQVPTTYHLDLTQDNSQHLEGDRYDYLVCTEVLEHTRQPFHALREIHRLLKPRGYLFGSTPCNFRIHGPLPDCWRFTEHGLKEMLRSSGFEIIELTALETPHRPLFPIDYTFVARKL